MIHPLSVFVYARSHAFIFINLAYTAKRVHTICVVLYFLFPLRAPSLRKSFVPIFFCPSLPEYCFHRKLLSFPFSFSSRSLLFYFHFDSAPRSRYLPSHWQRVYNYTAEYNTLLVARYSLNKEYPVFTPLRRFVIRTKKKTEREKEREREREKSSNNLERIYDDCTRYAFCWNFRFPRCYRGISRRELERREHRGRRRLLGRRVRE